MTENSYSVNLHLKPNKNNINTIQWSLNTIVVTSVKNKRQKCIKLTVLLYSDVRATQQRKKTGTIKFDDKIC